MPETCHVFTFHDVAGGARGVAAVRALEASLTWHWRNRWHVFHVLKHTVSNIYFLYYNKQGLSRFEHDLHTILYECSTVPSTVLYGLVRLNATFTRFTRHSLGLHTVPPTCVRVMLDLSHIRVFLYVHWLTLMDWLQKYSNFQWRNTYIIVIKLMADATDGRKSELEIMKRRIAIDTMYTLTRPCLTILNNTRPCLNILNNTGPCLTILNNTRPCLTILNHTRPDRIWPYLTIYDSYMNRIGRMTIVWTVCVLLSSIVELTSSTVVYTVSYGLTLSLTVLIAGSSLSTIHGHGIRARILTFLKIIHGFHGYYRMARV